MDQVQILFLLIYLLTILLSATQIVPLSIGAMIGAGWAMGFGAIGAGISTGFTAKNAVWGMSRNSKIGGVLTRTMLLGQAVAHAGAIYSLIIAFILLFSDKG